jgi:hypothetical protein
MKRERVLLVVSSLIGLLVVLFLVANFLVGSGSSALIVDVARSRCLQTGFRAEEMLADEVSCDNGVFGIGGRATVEFVRVGLGPWDHGQPKVLRVELRRRMNLLGWEAVSVWHQP